MVRGRAHLRRELHGGEGTLGALASLGAHKALLHEHAQQRLPPPLGAHRARACRSMLLLAFLFTDYVGAKAVMIH